MEHLSLHALNNLIKTTLDSQLDPSYWVVAEIGEMRNTQNGHCYLELVDKENDRVTAKVRGTIWSYTYRNLSTWFEGMTGQALQPGLKILCNVAVQFHELYGLSVNIKDIDANFTLGERARRRKEVIDKLVADGTFDMNRGHALPLVPQRIAIISSPTAAGFGDFMDQIEQNSRGYKFSAKLYKATMQGDKAALSIINAMMQVHDHIENYDALIIIRGGGSQVDLDCFDDYELASHIAQYPIPVLTGIGHERDETIADLVAHTRLKTPTAVAEFLISGIIAFDDQLDEYFSRLFHSVNQKINVEKQRLSSLGYQLKGISKEKTASSNYTLSHLMHKVKAAAKNYFHQQQKKLDLADNTMKFLDPQQVLKRGYTITTVNGKLIKNTTLTKGDVIVSESNNYIITSTVESSNKKNGKEKA
ncbi:exodeoxyribonuclease VII large subunit [Fulvivirga sediminis]|uniref:Exodeoxyribonuclease 7 large subunit n=1 Tax=Fulvivirga sediminis TaxID=2803949 RepID=A0A937K040_9BACT|nr:exodeoxyribonuclease VII large subunit [Fulvivirga sediminis]MBL3655945.1 exodeoxyribonuclease VII large subunit [Fulvivirga sediminis]